MAGAVGSTDLFIFICSTCGRVMQGNPSRMKFLFNECSKDFENFNQPSSPSLLKEFNTVAKTVGMKQFLKIIAYELGLAIDMFLQII